MQPGITGNSMRYRKTVCAVLAEMLWNIRENSTDATAMSRPVSYTHLDVYKRQVLVDGEAIDSCIYLTMWAEGRSIMTVEGLKGPNGELSPIQKAFIEEAAVQCGFCTPGLIMTAVEIVGTGKRYNRDELRKLISGHLCRCTGYENILNAMERIVEETYKVVGK